MVAATTSSKSPIGTVRDLATQAGGFVLQEMTMGDYLTQLGLYDKSTHSARWDMSLIHENLQRAILPIQKNQIKQRMFRDLLRGGSLPPVVLYQRDGKRPVVIDGLQRTDVAIRALSTLLALERDEAPEDFAKQELSEMKSLHQAPLSVEEFLNRPVFVQVWDNLEEAELVRLFMVLNVGQQKVSPRHLFEVMGSDLRAMFQEWGIKLLTERDEKELPRRHGRRAKNVSHNENVTPGLTHFRYEYLLDGLYAYVTRDPQVKTRDILEKSGDTADLAIGERIAEIGSEFCRKDFVWTCRDLNRAIQERYKGHPRASIAIQNSDNFFIPLMAALGDARANAQVKLSLEDRQTKLVELITSVDSDPLGLIRDDGDGLYRILDGIKSNIGRRQRAVVFIGWRQYFRNGPEEPDYPVNWRLASSIS